MIALNGCVIPDASSDAKLGRRHKIRPFQVLLNCSKRVAIQEPSYRVSIAVSTMRIKLTTSIASLNVDLCKITDSSNLHVVFRLNKMSAGDGSIRDQPSTMARFRAPCDLFSLCFADHPLGHSWGPQTKVIDTVEVARLAQGVLGIFGTANIVT